MILGIGTDIVTIDRIKQKVVNRPEFIKLVFSEKEIEYCNKNKNSFESFAARFAAKEALLKALGTGLIIDCDLTEIETLNESSGKPVLHLSSNLLDKMKEILNTESFKIHISLSHTSEYAVANLIIESV